MQMSELKKNNFYIYLSIIFFAIFLTIGTYNSEEGGAIDLDFDNSWIYAINYLWKFGYLGTKYFLTYGPLGFLHYTHPIHDNLLITAIFWLLIRFVFYLSLLYIIITYKREFIPELILVVIFSSFLVLTKMNIDYFFLFYLVTNFLILYNIESKINYLYFASLVSVLFFLINPGYSL